MEALRRTREFWAVPGLPKDLKVLFLSNFFWASGLGLYLYIWPVYVRSLGATESQVGLVLAASTLVASVAFIPGGVLADKYDRKRVMILGWSLALPAPFIFFYASHWSHLLPGVLLYFSSFLGIPALTAYIADFSPPEQRMTSFGFVYAGFPLGLTYSPALGAYLLNYVEIKHLFLIALIFYIASTLVMFFVRPSRPPAEPTRAGFLGLVRDRRLVRTVILLVVIMGVINLSYVYIPLILRDLHSATITDVQLLGMTISIGSAFLAAFLGRLADAWNRRGAILVAVGLYALSQTLYVFFFGPMVLVTASLLAGTFQAFRSIGDSMVTVAAPRGRQGQAMSLALMLQGLAITATSYLGGYLYEMEPRLPSLLSMTLLAPLALILIVTIHRYTSMPKPS